MQVRTWIGSAMLASAGLLGPVAVEPAQAQGPYPYPYPYPRGPQVAAHIWVEGEPDYFRRGDRLDVRFSVSEDAYVAVVHVDTDGSLDFLFPATPWDLEFVRGGRTHTLPVRGAGSSWMVRGRAGIGYFYLIASPRPLDFANFRGGFRSSPWDWGYAGRLVHGDPFLAFEQITRLLVPGWPYAPYVFDYYGYHVEGLHRYPAYACSDQFYDGGWGWTPSYGRCNELDLFLLDQPYYYDTRRYRGDRRTYLREFEDLDPRHRFKEAPDEPARGVGSVDLRRQIRPSRDQTVDDRDTRRREPSPPADGRWDGSLPEPSSVPDRDPAGSVDVDSRRPPANTSGRGNSDADPPSRRPARGVP